MIRAGSLDDMVAFATVVRDGSFTSGARSLGITKQSASERIARLEQRLGVQLLIRTTRALHLTEAGARYHEACTAIVARADAADREARQTQQRAAGTVRITAPVGLGGPLVIPAAGDITRAHPEVRIEVVLDERVVDLVRDGVDLAVRAGSVASTPAFIARPLFETATAIVASPAFVAAHGRPRDPRALASLPCVARSAGETWTIAGHAISITSALAINTFEGVRDAAIAGLGAARIPLASALDDLRAHRLVALFVPTGTIAFTALWPARRLPLRVRLVVDALVRRGEVLAAEIAAVVAGQIPQPNIAP